MSASITYRPDVDGLRAIAVLGVLFFHAGLGFPGGYVGVDVFFVISGYLITSLLLKDLRAGTFSILDFWERRIRRIVPALAVVVLAVMAAGWFLLLPIDYEVLGKQVVALVACASNVKFWLESGYFDAIAEEKPLLHTWSLSVEEQFYLVIPLLFALLFKLRKSAWIPVLLTAGIGGSFALSVYGSYRHPSAAFYLLPFRAWELGVGSLLAFARPISSPRLANGAASLGIAGILVAYFAYPPGIRFPGFAALPPVAGAALLIWAGSQRNSGTAEQRNTVTRLLSTRPLVAIGLASYSLYLWHWPTFAFQKYLGFKSDSWAVQLALAAAAFPLAWLSLRFVERPFRSRQILRSRRMVFALGAAVFAALVLPSLLLWRSNGAKQRLSPAEQRIAAGQMDSAFINELTEADIPERLVEVGAPGPVPAVFVWGDSHAMAVLPAIDAACKRAGIVAKAATASGTPPVLDWHKVGKHGLNEAAPSYNAAIFHYLDELSIRHDPPLVVLAARWSIYFEDNHGGGEFADALRRSLLQLRERGMQVVIVEEMPMFDFEPPRILTLAARTGVNSSTHITTVAIHQARTAKQHAAFETLQGEGIRLLNPVSCFSAQDGTIAPADARGLLWRDSNHLSTYGARRLESVFAEMLAISGGSGQTSR